MIKVIIADDEQKVCQLIFDLISWETYDMQVVKMAYNGVQALQYIEQERPALVITDIKMPGMDGLELIQRAKGINPDMEVVIISGYRFFEYAQKAIKYGVNDYLLKPIKKAELAGILEKVQKKYKERIEYLTEQERVRQQMKMSHERVREQFLTEYLKEKKIALLGNSIEEINERYYMNFQPGAYFIIGVNVDYDYRERYGQGVGLLLRKIISIMKHTLDRSCCELECGIRENSVWCIVNTQDYQIDNLKKKIKEAFDQISVQKTVFPQFDFTCGIGKIVDHITDLDVSLAEAQAAIAERLVRGTGKVISNVKPTEIRDSNRLLLENTKKNIRKSVFSLDVDGLVSGIKDFARKLPDDTTGSELYKMVQELGRFYAISMRENEFGGELLTDFENELKRRGNCCADRRRLLMCLEELVASSGHQAVEHKAQEGIRPVRLAKNYISQNYMKAITLEEMSILTGFNASYFSLLFKKETGQNFVEYVTGVRMEKAKELLRETVDSIAVICESVGYNDVKHFTKTFKKDTGLKPSEYRKLYS